MVRTLAMTPMVAGTRRHPFVNGIMEVHPPPSWKHFTMDKYDGTIDPNEHLNVYLTQVEQAGERKDTDRDGKKMKRDSFKERGPSQPRYS
ncbi:hypothetical protein JHK82_018734 [Glycine max]|nr:hypothetical protein JHK85_019176 [Glycine max]KAG5037917.1 hypothetical protein JHK86_018757 [Glycine max]KAG5143039.1 hypothetical protein JHK82_018734 [Glycine max]